jgi:hypothetical protein
MERDDKEYRENGCQRSQLTEQAFDISKVRKIEDWHPSLGQKVELSRVCG